MFLLSCSFGFWLNMCTSSLSGMWLDVPIEDDFGISNEPQRNVEKDRDVSLLAKKLELTLEGDAASGFFTGELLIMQGDEVELSRRSWGAPVGSHYAIGSLTKQFAAASILLLVERGKLRREDWLLQYFPEVAEDVISPAIATITIDHLLTHTSGSPGSLPRMFDPLSRVNADAGAYLRNQQLTQPPGEHFAYSNTNYELLGEVIRRVSGRDFASFAQQELFDRHGMNSTSVGIAKLDQPLVVAGHLLTPLGLLSSNLALPASMASLPVGLSGASGAGLSTTDDLVRWILALRAGEVLTSVSRQILWKVELEQYARGWVVEPCFYGPQIWHNGAISPAGYQSFLAYFPEVDLIIVVLSNVDISSYDLTARLKGVLKQRNEVAPASIWNPFIGILIPHFFHLGGVFSIFGVAYIFWKRPRVTSRRKLIRDVGNAWLIAGSVLAFEDFFVAMLCILTLAVAGGYGILVPKLFKNTNESYQGVQINAWLSFGMGSTTLVMSFVIQLFLRNVQ